MNARFKLTSPLESACLSARSVWVLVALFFAGSFTFAQGVQHLSITEPGGMPGLPVMTGIQPATNGMTITWDGPAGYYQVWHKLHLKDSSWIAVGKGTNVSRITTITTRYSNDFFRVSGPAPQYAGASACAECHQNVHDAEVNTAHAQAFQALQQIHQDTNPSCLPCHTVGYRLPSGFVSALQTPQLEGVQCENCHGPAGNHAANPSLAAMIPRVELAAQVCGGCHNGEHPTFDEWQGSGHGAVVPDVLQSMAASTNSISSCGRCHSGSARLALIQGRNPAVTLTNDYNIPITCAICHDPHAPQVWTNELNGIVAFTNSLTGNAAYVTNNQLGPVYTNQLRCALSSTNDFYLTTSDIFTNKYDPAINVCAQCHNHRGATSGDTSRPPHHSPQYNMLLGTVGAVMTNQPFPDPSTHSRLEMQCSACHMQATNGSPSHTFQVVTYQLCYNCHSDPAGLVQFTSNNISGQIQLTKALLDMWATNSSPDELRTNYGTFAWEYSSPGDLSPGGVGPTNATQQAMIPNDIKKARFDLYLVLYDGSYGVHNAPYDVQLLQDAQIWVDGQLFQ